MLVAAGIGFVIVALWGFAAGVGLALSRIVRDQHGEHVP